MRKIGFALALLTTFSVMDTAEAAKSWICTAGRCTCDYGKDCDDLRYAGVCADTVVCDPACHCKLGSSRSGAATHKPPPRGDAKSQ
jgi:hypothetical protein